MALDENGNVKSSGWGKALGDVAGLIAGNPRADAEADAFRTQSEFNKLKLGEAKKTADEAAKLEPFKVRINQLISGWDDPDTTQDDPESGSTHPISIPGKKHAPIFTHDPKNGFVIDPTIASQRLPEYMSIMHRVYGHEAMAKMHPFFNQAAIAAPTAGQTPADFEAATGRTPDGANAERRYGQPGLINALNHGLAPRTAEQEKIKLGNAVTAAKTAGTVGKIDADNKTLLELSHGMIKTPEGWRIGPDSPLGKLLAAMEGGEEEPAVQPTGERPPDDMTSHGSSGFPEVVTKSDDNSSESSTPTGTEQPLTPEGDPAPEPIFDLYRDPVTKQYGADKKTASSSKLAESISGGVKKTRNKDGSFTLTPNEPQREMNPAEAARDTANALMLSRLPTEAEKQKKRELDDSWASGVGSRFSEAVADKEGDKIGATQSSPIATLINDTRLDLEERGFDPDKARSIAFQIVQDKYKDKYQTNWEMWGDNLIEEKTAGPGKWDWIRGGAGDGVSGSDAAKYLGDAVASDINKVHNMYVDRAQYEKRAPKILEEMGFQHDFADQDPKLSAMLVGIAWMEDVVAKAHKNGYRFSAPIKGSSKHMIKTMQNPSEDIDSFNKRIQEMKEYILANYAS